MDFNDELEAEVLVIGAYPCIADPSRHTVSLPRLARIVSSGISFLGIVIGPWFFEPQQELVLRPNLGI